MTPRGPDHPWRPAWVSASAWIIQQINAQFLGRDQPSELLPLDESRRLVARLRRIRVYGRETEYVDEVSSQVAEGRPLTDSQEALVVMLLTSRERRRRP